MTQRSPVHGPRTQCGPYEPPRTLGTISASLEGSPPRPSRAPRVSASLEGSEPTLEQADQLRLARGPPRQKGQTAIRSLARRMEALNAHHSAAAPGSDGVRPPLRTVAVTRVLSANSGHCSGHPWRCGDTVGSCDAVQDVLGTAPTNVLPIPRTSLVLSPPRNPRTAWAWLSEAAPTLTRTRPRPAGPSEHRHAMPGGRYPPQQLPRCPLELP